MRFNILLLLLLVVSTGCSRVEGLVGEKTSFGEQLCELSTLRDLGLISDKEYKVRRHRINNVMMH